MHALHAQFDFLPFVAITIPPLCPFSAPCLSMCTSGDLQKVHVLYPRHAKERGHFV